MSGKDRSAKPPIKAMRMQYPPLSGRSDDHAKHPDGVVVYGEEWIANQQITGLRSLVVPGAVFMLADRATGRSTKHVSRPAVVVMSPVFDGPALEVIQRRVRISTRSSWKAHLFPFPADDSAVLNLLNQHGIIFTAAGVLPRFTKPGFFELKRREGATLGSLTPANFIGWLPRPYVEWMALRLTGHALKVPYPPAA